jgi:hypothetical protein
VDQVAQLLDAIKPVSDDEIFYQPSVAFTFRFRSADSN